MKLMIVLPQYAGWCHTKHMMSVVAFVRDLAENGIEFDILSGSDSAVHRNRYLLTESFLRARVGAGERPDSGDVFTHMMFIDGDIEFTTQDWAKLAALDADVAVGCYGLKREGQELAAWHDGKLMKLDDLGEEAFDVDYAGTGFMLIKREVFDAIGPMCPWVKTEQHGLQRRWWSFDMDGAAELPEDYSFCKKVRDAGLRVVMEPTVRLKHWGMKGY